jgi:hypothetical protein
MVFLSPVLWPGHEREAPRHATSYSGSNSHERRQISMTQEYIPAYYSTYVDSLLAAGAEPAQGGHLEAGPQELHRALYRISFSHYSFLWTEIANTLGMEKAMALMKRELWNRGKHWGRQTRLRLERRGLPLDMGTLRGRPGGVLQRLEYDLGNYIYSPHFVTYDMYGCPSWDQMKRLMPRELAIMHCEDIHVNMAKEFNPDIDQWFEALLSKGQAKCTFVWRMTFEAAERAAEVGQSYRERAQREGWELDGEWKGPGKPPDQDEYGKIVYRYHFPIDELLRTMEEEQVDALVRRAMHKWGTWRGEMMREDHEKRGWELNVRNLITYFDEPSDGESWTAENVVLTDTEHSKDVVKSAITEKFQEMGTGQFAPPYYEEALPAMAKAYNPAIEVTIPKLMERGDSYSRIEYRTLG